jgi:hypothetical protein
MKVMRTKYRGKRMALFLAAILPALAAPLGATDIFKARMLTGKAPVQPAMVNVQIEVESWTTPEEIRQLQDVMSQAGIDAFLAAFKQMDKGTVRFMASRGWNLPIHAALTVPTEKGKKVLLFFNRQTWDPGSQIIRGRHFFMVIELTLNAKGTGEGRFYEDAQIKLDSMLGKIEMETYESSPKIFPRVQEVVKKTPGS